jgi:ABC-2 type transport system ATP-binding protein
MATPVISVNNLSKKYGAQLALSNATFEVPLGTICGFVGPNGAGKTTTIRILLGLISPTTGTAKVLGESVTKPEKYLTQVGAMIEGPAFYPALSGAENLRVLATLGGIDHEVIPELMQLVGLADRAESKYKTYSLGMKQRLGIAAALLPNPKLLILDEPTNGLDPAGIQEIRELLQNLAAKGVTVFVSSHLLSEIEMICEHLVVLRKGEVIFAGAVKDLLQRNHPTIIAKPVNQADCARLISLSDKRGEIIDGAVYLDAPETFAAELNKIAFENGILLAQLTPVLPTLEKTFFEITGGN